MRVRIDIETETSRLGEFPVHATDVTLQLESTRKEFELGGFRERVEEEFKKVLDYIGITK